VFGFKFVRFIYLAYTYAQDTGQRARNVGVFLQTECVALHQHKDERKNVETTLKTFFFLFNFSTGHPKR
jgi:hypothetical protein